MAWCTSAFGSHGDNSPWHGWVLGYNATTLQQTMFYNSTPNGNGGGIWQGGGGLATDATGDIYFVTSNGDFDVNTGGVDYGDSVVKLEYHWNCGRLLHATRSAEHERQ